VVGFLEEALPSQIHQPDAYRHYDDVFPTYVSRLPSYLQNTFWNELLIHLTEWSGINALLYYGPMLVTSIGLRGDLVTLLVSGGIGIVQFLAVIPAILYLDRLGTCSCSYFVIIRFGGLI